VTGETPGSHPSSIASAVVFALSEHGQSVAVAESLTGGMLCSALIDVPGASVVVRGGVVAYATDLKHRLLGVDAGLLSANGPVDPDVAAQMAHGVRELLGADWGMATTGVAGPDPQDGIPAGTVYIAVAGPLVNGTFNGSPPADAGLPEEPLAAGQPISARVVRLELRGGRTAVRAATTIHALTALLAELPGPADVGDGPGTR
jgi:nicotinamide-nucleotide amidase